MDVDELQHALGGIVLEAATLHGGRKSHDVMVTARTLGEVSHVADQVAGAAHDLRAAMLTALGSGWVFVENQLQQELGRDITTDPGH
jgi:hypothetical protein